MPDAKGMVSRAQQFDYIAWSDKVRTVGGDLAECLINDARLTLRFAQIGPIGRGENGARIINFGRNL